MKQAETLLIVELLRILERIENETPLDVYFSYKGHIRYFSIAVKGGTFEYKKGYYLDAAGLDTLEKLKDDMESIYQEERAKL